VLKKITLIIFLLLLSGNILPESQVPKNPGPVIDVVFCLDLSNSSNGLIDHFRNHLWDYWFFFSRCEPKPNFRIGVVTYARFSYGKSNGYSKVMKDLGSDFERLSNILYKIPSRIEKGDQYVGSALNTCLKKVSWSKDPNAKKIIFLVGNGDVNTGTVELDKVIDQLNEKNITVNSVYCTAPGEKQAITGWQKIAHDAGGQIHTISLRTYYFDSLNGFDLKKFRLLNRKFNNTYLYYGEGGRARWKMLQSEDNHIYVTNTEGFRFRSWYKVSGDYQRKNTTWDLVDLHAKNPEAYLDIDRTSLNDTCKRMSDPQLRSYIVHKKYERKRLAKLISEMLIEKEEKDKQDGITINRNQYTLDVICLQILKETLMQANCQCKNN
jgi:hypothetical protein